MAEINPSLIGQLKSRVKAFGCHTCGDLKKFNHHMIGDEMLSVAIGYGGLLVIT
jgi:hypothetical protein